MTVSQSGKVTELYCGQNGTGGNGYFIYMTTGQRNCLAYNENETARKVCLAEGAKFNGKNETHDFEMYNFK